MPDPELLPAHSLSASGLECVLLSVSELDMHWSLELEP